MKKIIYLVLTNLACLFAYSQGGVGIGTNTPNANSILDLTSTNKGFLPPRMTTAQRDAIASPTEGLIIFNTTKQCLEVYNATETVWKSSCGDDSTSAVFDPICSTLSVNGSYLTGVQLEPSANFITLNVSVSEIGSYAVVCSAGGMVFTASGTFTVEGTQQITLRGQGYPANVGLNYLSFVINNTICSAVVNVQNGLATVTSCGTATISDQVIAGQTYGEGEIILTLDPINYSGGNVYGISTAPLNGIALSSPLQGTFQSASPATLEIDITGTPLIPGNTTLDYDINTQSCSVTIPVTSGTGLASNVTCGGTLAGTYQTATPMNASNKKTISLANVTTAGSFFIRTNEANGVYFSANYSTSSTGLQTVDLVATGTPIGSGTHNYIVNVSSGATTFATCNFDVTYTPPSTFPDFNLPQCAPLGVNYTYVKASNTNAGDNFGGYKEGTIDDRFSNWQVGENGGADAVKMSADGLYLVVGAIGDDGVFGNALSNASSNSGAAYIYTRPTTSAAFTFQAYIKPNSGYGGANDWFGACVDISNDGSTIIVGAPAESSDDTQVGQAAVYTPDNNKAKSGAAYVFTRSGSTWTQLAYLKADNTTAHTRFGYSVAVSGNGNRFAVGSLYEGNKNTGIGTAPVTGATQAGAVYAYTRSGATVTFQTRIKPSKVKAYDWFGASVDLDDNGTTLAVGVPGEDGSGLNVNPPKNTSAADAGAVYMFFYNGTNWTEQAYLKPSNTISGVRMGYDVALSGNGNRLVVGAPSEDGTLAASSGSASSGAIYLFERTGSTWAAKQRIKADNFGAGDGFGFRVDYSNDGTTVVAGAPFEDTSFVAALCPNFTANNSLSNAGAIYVFRENAGSYIQAAMLKMRTQTTAAQGATAEDYLGYSASISGDGRSVAAGIPGEDGNALNVNGTINNSAGNLTGAVMVFTTN